MNTAGNDHPASKDLSHFRWRGILCSLFVPGLGHFAIGHGHHALHWYAVCLAATFLGVIGYAWSPITMWAGIAATVVAWSACVVDVARRAPGPRIPGLLILLFLMVVSSIPTELVEPSLRRKFGQTLRVSTANMVPTLLVDDHVMVRKTGSIPELGQVVVYRSPLDPQVSEVARVVGLPGDDIEWDGKVLLRNGEPVEQSMSVPCGTDCATVVERLGAGHYSTRVPAGEALSPYPKTTVDEGHVFVISDDRRDERDSRIFGAIPTNAVIGVAAFVYYAFDESGIRWERLNQPIS
jgi:signal peptidase I